MTETPDLEELARQYLDLWQEQLSDFGADAEMAEAIAKSIELMNGSAAAFATMMAQTASNNARDNHHDEGSPGAIIKTTGATPAGSASGHSDDVLDQLSERITQLERRIAELEPASGKRGKRAKKKT